MVVTQLPQILFQLFILRLLQETKMQETKLETKEQIIIWTKHKLLLKTTFYCWFVLSAFMTVCLGFIMTKCSLPIILLLFSRRVTFSFCIFHLLFNLYFSPVNYIFMDMWMQGFRSFVWTAVSYQLKDKLKLSPSASQLVSSIVFFPWSIKPLYG